MNDPIDGIIGLLLLVFLLCWLLKMKFLFQLLIALFSHRGDDRDDKAAIEQARQVIRKARQKEQP